MEGACGLVRNLARDPTAAMDLTRYQPFGHADSIEKILGLSDRNSIQYVVKSAQDSGLWKVLRYNT